MSDLYIDGAAGAMMSLVRRMHDQTGCNDPRFTAFERGMLAGFKIASNGQPNGWQLESWANEAHFLAYTYRKDAT